MTDDIGSADTLAESAAGGFAERFGVAPEATSFAPGRVNLLGEHTDYNGGYVLPMPLSLGTAVSIGRGGQTGTIRIASDSFGGEELRWAGEPATGAWSDYILGSVAAGAPDLAARTGLQIFVASDLPVGAGLSSSAAIEVATLRAVNALGATEADPVEIARTARRVENDFVGMPCGIMDQFAVSVGSVGRALFLDTRLLRHRDVELPAGYRVLVIHSGVSHKLTDDGYATRVAECRAACDALGVEMLSDLGSADLDRIAALTPPLDGRARHVVTENARVLAATEALREGDAKRFAALMVESHASQRDDYAVSVPEVDALVATALEVGAAGARLTGGGFGGSVVAIVHVPQISSVCDGIVQRHPKARLLAMT